MDSAPLCAPIWLTRFCCIRHPHWHSASITGRMAPSLFVAHHHISICIWSISLRHTEHLDWCLNGLSGAFVLILGSVLLFVRFASVHFAGRRFASHCKIPLCFCMRGDIDEGQEKFAPGIEDLHSSRGKKREHHFQTLHTG
jgi:hypothetical protein